GICPADERYSSCIQGECRALNCTEKGQPITCPRFAEGFCQKGCVCVEGFLRAADGSCVPEDKCADIINCILPFQLHNSHNVDKTKCFHACKPVLLKQHAEPVASDTAAYRALRGANTNQCRGQNEFFSCGSACDNECSMLATQNRTNCPIKNIMCNKKCYCDDGFARDDKKQCLMHACHSKFLIFLDETCKGPNEEYVSCKKTCPPELCRSIVSRYSCSAEPPCQPGCACKSGFFRVHKFSPCVHVCDCPEMRGQTCEGPNEEYLHCKRSCPPEECYSLIFQFFCSYEHPCEPGCACKPGFLRLENSPCIPICDCPYMAEDPRLLSCVQDCPPETTCRTRGIQYKCQQSEKKCEMKCVCKPGYYKNALGDCITEKECDLCQGPNEFFSCGSACDNECLNLATQNRTNCQTCEGPNEDYVQCKRHCPPQDCFSLVFEYRCSTAHPCRPGCETCEGPNEEYLDCKRTCPPEVCFSILAFFDCRNQPPCTPGCACKTCDDPNEEYVDCKETCPPETCFSILAFYDCTDEPPCKPGCACKDAYYRKEWNTNCVASCECPQLYNEEHCKTCDDPNEEYVDCKETCPPEICFSISAFYDCDDAPPCKPGCACKDDHYRKQWNTTCVASCECPQMYNDDHCVKLVTIQMKNMLTANEPALPRHATQFQRLSNATMSLHANQAVLAKVVTIENIGIQAAWRHASKTCDDPNEEYVDCKQTCPPETCFSMQAFYDCTDEPPCEPGCACKGDHYRKDWNTTCVAECECPQMYNATLLSYPLAVVTLAPSVSKLASQSGSSTQGWRSPEQSAPYTTAPASVATVLERPISTLACGGAMMVYLIADDGARERRADDAGQRGHGVGEAHQHAGVRRSYDGVPYC
ncbi:Serine protease inhibitor 28, partial [Operophtera brumata]